MRAVTVPPSCNVGGNPLTFVEFHEQVVFGRKAAREPANRKHLAEILSRLGTCAEGRAFRITDDAHAYWVVQCGLDDNEKISPLFLRPYLAMTAPIHDAESVDESKLAAVEAAE